MKWNAKRNKNPAGSWLSVIGWVKLSQSNGYAQALKGGWLYCKILYGKVCYCMVWYGMVWYDVFFLLLLFGIKSLTWCSDSSACTVASPLLHPSRAGKSALAGSPALPSPCSPAPALPSPWSPALKRRTISGMVVGAGGPTDRLVRWPGHRTAPPGLATPPPRQPCHHQYVFNSLFVWCRRVPGGFLEGSWMSDNWTIGFLTFRIETL